MARPFHAHGRKSRVRLAKWLEGRWQIGLFGHRSVELWQCTRCPAGAEVIQRTQLSKHAWDVHGVAIDSLRPSAHGFTPTARRRPRAR